MVELLEKNLEDNDSYDSDSLGDMFESRTEEQQNKLIKFSQRANPFFAVSSEFTDKFTGMTSYNNFYHSNYNWQIKAAKVTLSETDLNPKLITAFYDANVRLKELEIKTREFSVSINAVNLVDIAKLAVKNIDFTPTRLDSDGNLELDENNFVKFFLHEYALRMFYSSSYDPSSLIEPPKDIRLLENKIREFHRNYENLPLGALFICAENNYLSKSSRNSRSILQIGRKNSPHLSVPYIYHPYVGDNVNGIGFDNGVQVALAIPSVNIIYDLENKFHHSNQSYRAELNNRLWLNSHYSIGVEYKSKVELASIAPKNSNVLQIIQMHLNQDKGYFEYNEDSSSVDRISYEQKIQRAVKSMNISEELIFLQTDLNSRKGFNVFSRNLHDEFSKHLGIK